MAFARGVCGRLLTLAAAAGSAVRVIAAGEAIRAPANATHLADELGQLAASGISVTVVSHVCPNEACHFETKPVTLFLGSAYNQVNLGCGGDNTHTFTYHPGQVGGFGVQENGWYWRGPAAKASEQNPDNAGMQVFVDADCAVRTGAGIAGGAEVDARLLLKVSGRRRGGACEVVLERAAQPGLCLAGSGRKACCPPCSVAYFAGSPNCCKAEVDGAQTTCFRRRLQR